MKNTNISLKKIKELGILIIQGRNLNQIAAQKQIFHAIQSPYQKNAFRALNSTKFPLIVSVKGR